MRYDSVYELAIPTSATVGFAFTPHTLRHTHATLARRGGMPLELLQRMLTHRSQTSTSISAHLDVEDLRRELERAGMLGSGRSRGRRIVDATGSSWEVHCGHVAGEPASPRSAGNAQPTPTHWERLLARHRLAPNVRQLVFGRRCAREPREEPEGESARQDRAVRGRDLAASSVEWKPDAGPRAHVSWPLVRDARVLRKGQLLQVAARACATTKAGPPGRFIWRWPIDPQRARLALAAARRARVLWQPHARVGTATWLNRSV